VIIKSAEVEDKEYYIEELLIKKNCTLMKKQTIEITILVNLHIL
jgi:hypothetical protein